MENIFQTMRARHSVRAYAGVPLTNAEREALNEAAVQARSPFGPKLSLIHI